jgi:hypothetical protein
VMVNVVPLVLALIKKKDLATFYHNNINLLLGPPIIFLICISWTRSWEVRMAP